MPLAVLAGAISAESYSFRTAIRESNHTRGRKSWIEFVRTAKAPELPVVLLEDFGLLLVSIAVVLALETKSLLLGESAPAADVRALPLRSTAPSSGSGQPFLVRG